MLDGGGHMPTCLVETATETTCAGEQIETHGPIVSALTDSRGTSKPEEGSQSSPREWLRIVAVVPSIMPSPHEVAWASIYPSSLPVARNLLTSNEFGARDGRA